MTSPNETPESTEENIKTPTRRDPNLSSRLLKLYVDEKMQKKDDRFSFVRTIEKSTNISESTLKDIEKFARKNKDFDGLDINNENLSVTVLKREVSTYIATISQKKAQLRDLFLQEFDIENSLYTKKILPEIDVLPDEKKLEDLLGNFSARKNFLKKLFPKDTPALKNLFTFLKGLDLGEKVKKLSGGKRESFLITVEKMQKGNSLEKEDIWELFESGVFSQNEKQRILEIFIPTLTLAQGVELGIFTKIEAESYKKELLKKAFDTSLFSSDTQLDSYISEVSDEDVHFSTNGFFLKKGVQDTLIDSHFFVDEFLKQYNNLIEKIHTNLEKDSIQTASEMLDHLKNYGNVSGLASFGVGATMMVKQKINSGNAKTEEAIIFGEITSVSDKGYFTLTEKGLNQYDDQVMKTSRITYSDFLNYLTPKSGQSETPESVDFLSQTELKKKIISGDIIDVNHALQLTNKKIIANDIQSLTEKINIRERELQKSGVPNNKREDDPELQGLKAEREKLNNDIRGIDEFNEKAIENKIAHLDSQGEKFGFAAGVTIQVDEGKGDAYTIEHIDTVNQTLILSSVAEKRETVTYAQFTQSFEQRKARRVSNIKDFSEIFTQGGEAFTQWGNFEYKDKAIRKKDSKLKVDFHYLVPPKGGDKEMLKIHRIDGDSAEISFGEVQKSKKNKDGEVFSVEGSTYKVSIGVLESLIRKHKLVPRSLEEGKVQEEEMGKIPKLKNEFHFGSWFFQNTSIIEAVKGGKIFFEQFQHMMHEGQENHANHFAMSVFGKLLPEDSRIDLQSRIEQTEKKEMDEHLSRLKGINSALATAMIERWLKDKRTPEYKKEAGLMYMMEKYGALCAKGPLYKYKGQFFWYQALGGRVNPPDENFLEVKAANDKLGVNTTEEELVYRLVKRQTGIDSHGHHGFLGVHRRSKLDKELKAVRGQGKMDEMETGRKDGAAERDVQERITGGLSEMSSGNYPNAIGWLEKVVDKGGSMRDMNKIPFVMMFSGMAYEFEKDMTDHLKNFPANSRMLPMLRFISYQRDIALVNDTILEITKRLDKKGGKYGGIYDAAKNIYGEQKNRNIPEKKKQQATIDFYDGADGLWGEAITNALYMLNTGKTDDTINKMIFFGKDNTVDENGKEIAGTGNETFRRYYELLHGYIRADGDFGKEEGLMSDAFAEKGTSGIDMYRAAKHLLVMRTGGVFAKQEAGPVMWNEIRKEFEAIPKRKYDEHPVKNRKMQEKILEENLRFLVAGLLEAHGSDTRALTSYNSPTSAFNKLNEWGVYLSEFADVNANNTSVLAGEHKDLFQRFIKQILSVENNGANFTKRTRMLPTGGYEILSDTGSGETGISDLIGQKVGKIVGDAKRGAQIQDIMKQAKKGTADESVYEEEDSWV